MEDGPKLLPQWLRGSSSALHHRGDISDASKRGKPAGGFDASARSAAPPDPWLARGGSSAALNGAISAAPLKSQSDFGRIPDRGSLSERSWKPRDNGYPNTGGRSGYVPAGLRHSSRDDRDGISLKPGGGYSAGRAYGRSGESEGGGSGGGARSERGQDHWQPARTASASASAGNGGGGGGRGNDDARSPLRTSGLATSNGSMAGVAAVPSKASFEADFPSLRPSSASGSASSPGPPHGNAVQSAATTTSAPLTSGTGAAAAAATATASSLLDTANSPATLPPYRKTFLSSRTSSNWTSKLAEAPAAPSAGPSPAQPVPVIVLTEDDALTPEAVACTQSASPPPLAPATVGLTAGSTAAPAPAPAPAAPVPVPVVPPRPSGVWGTTSSAAAVAAAADSGHGSIAGAGAPVVNRTRLDNLAMRQSKQLIPVISSGSGKSKAVGGLGVAAGGTPVGGLGGTGPRAPGGAPKPPPIVPTGALLKMSTVKRDDAVPGPGTSGPGARVLGSSNTVMFSKKASQPLDRPLALARTSSSSSSSPNPALAQASAGVAVVPSTGACGSSLGNGIIGGAVPCAPCTGLDTADEGSNTLKEPPLPAAAVVVAAAADELGELPVTANTMPAQLSLPQQTQPVGVLPQRASSAPHPALHVSEEEEAFLRSLGWTGFDEEDGDGEDTGLTEEEIAAFRAQQQRQQAAAASVGSLSAAAAAGPKAVPGIAARRRGKALIVAASYGSEQVSSSSDSDSEC
ncbi:hypothetical protein VOLCADRAFT_99572 [Volvox carteri f. nagariensis]|uniref:Uncharacterized protein n=1 Tax=Volvox carteri f. nagariensis TaxID=3068 RepID=D8UI30_VOLCA|nr:uncharacterized protein VOLCADRAFT_99572 [Volvox carteri f. nagariensis]EFJ40626.1 hypothetical protein VOLCADRAFT_99572 [Volvox carteri f. nagariensis]|eukprot:XP_002958333.1 hypothetical protein VOLCADRAFT_99572 [Volvox carteri f. nagariensis]